MNKLTRNLYLFIQCSALRIKNRVLRKKLQINHAFLLDSIVIEGAPVCLLWSAEGCHKIEVNNLGAFAGNSHGVKYIMNGTSRPIRVIFYGTGESKTVNISHNSSKVTLLEKFFSKSALPCLTKTYPDKIIIRHQLNLFRTVIRLSGMALPESRIDFKTITIKLDAFERANQ